MDKSKLIFVGGKGGVGKSTISSVIASYCSRNKNTLLISTDPAHNLSDIFEINIKSEITKIDSRLYAIEIDARKEIKKYLNTITNDVRAFVQPNSYEMVDKYYNSLKDSPMAQESALFDRLINIVINDYDKWDKIIIDTAPTGHTLRLFTLPLTLSKWSKSLLKEKYKNDNIENILGNINEDNTLQKRLEKRYETYSKFNKILKDKRLCNIMFILNPDYLSTQETIRSIEQLKSYKIAPYMLIINKIIPKDSNDLFYKQRAILQEKYLHNISTQFKQYKMLKIPLKSYDIKGKSFIEAMIEDIQYEF